MRHMMLLALALTILGGRANGGEAVRNLRVFEPGEELQYAVRWQFVRLGTLVVRTVRDSMCRTPDEVKIILAVASNPDLKVISIREFNESIVNTVSLTSSRFRGKHTSGDATVLVRQTYDPDARIMTYRVTEAATGRAVRADTLRNCSPYVEGPSLLFHTRAIAHSLGTYTVPTCVSGEVSSTHLRFCGDIEEVEIDATSLPVRTRRFTGRADWTGASSAGVSGDFTGWLSDDEAAVPIRARMKMILGSITLELESWNRPGWAPPTGLTAEVR